MWLHRVNPTSLPVGALGATLSYLGWSAFCEELPARKPAGAFALGNGSNTDAKIVRMSYMSTMRGDKTVAGLTLEGIAQQSVLRNACSRISGMMCYDMPLKQVWQVIEGGHEDVATLWEQISKDPRHAIDHDSIVCEEADNRRYPKGWGMRYSRFDKLNHSDSHEGVCSSGDLVQVMYKSFLKDQGGGEMQVMEEVVKRAITTNAKLDITGWLLYNDRTLTVYQVLEGPPQIVNKLVDIILKDPRHDVCLDTVKRRAIEQREFPCWSMVLDSVQQPTWSTAAAY